MLQLRKQLDSEGSGHNSSGFSMCLFLFPNLCSLSPEPLFFPFLPLSSSSPCWPSSEASPASEQNPAGKDAAPESSALPPASSATSQGNQLPASTAVGSALCSGSSGPALLPPLTPASASRPSSTAPGPPKASPTIEKLPYVPHSPFHLFSYDFEDSPLSAKEKEAESQKESR